MPIESRSIAGKDIELVIRAIRSSMPIVIVRQYEVMKGSDDDGVWNFSLEAGGKNIQLESSTYNCPFVIETDEQCCKEALKANDVEEVVRLVLTYLRAVEGGSSVFLKGSLHWI